MWKRQARAALLRTGFGVKIGDNCLILPVAFVPHGAGFASGLSCGPMFQRIRIVTSHPRPLLSHECGTASWTTLIEQVPATGSR
jgi:hypothetical protein